MLTYSNQIVRTSVRRLVEFLLRAGDMAAGSGLRADVEAMQEGSRLHRKIQKAQKATYQSEVLLRGSWEQEEYTLVLEGRADGIDRVTEEETETGEEVSLYMIDEIKCVYRDVTQIEEPEPLHLAQAKCYAYLYGREQGLEEILVQITYCNMETEEIHRLKERYSMEELEVWFAELLDGYRLWADYYVKARKRRQDTIQEMEFPFVFRQGQKQMAAIIYQAIEKGNHIFLQAPTGIGKTMSAVYPALRQMGTGKAEKIFYLTAKTITRTAAEQALRILGAKGLSLKSLTITARERICILERPECDPALCERAAGHYDRINTALFALLEEQEAMTREIILEYAERYRVCPYELGVEAAAWADCVICDYNYIFDPHVNARNLSGTDGGGKDIYLIDEAHNLLDRARDMYSALLRREDLTYLKKTMQDKNRQVAKKIQNCLRQFSQIEKEAENIEKGADGLYFPMMQMLGALEEELTEHPEWEEREQREKVVEIYFSLRHFLMILEQKQEGYQIYGTGAKKTFALHLFCVDPSECLAEYLERSRASIFFSATLLPIPYYKQLLGGNAGMDAYRIPSPFAPERCLLAVTEDVTSQYKQRGEDQYRRIVRYLELTVEQKMGNYMIFFPSYEMLTACLEIAREGTLSLAADFAVQEPSMGEQEREDYLAQFQERSGRSLIGFCVLGSIFSEGIDLAGKRLLGVFVVGTGLPLLCKEREIIREYFDTHGKKGYDYAYRYPGMNKVLQAAGRVIRTPEDVGCVVLMDYRFLWKENQRLLPQEWESFYEVNQHNYSAVLKHFWDRWEKTD